MRNLVLVFAAFVAFGVLLFIGTGAALAAETAPGLPSSTGLDYTCDSFEGERFCTCDNVMDCLRMRKDKVCSKKATCDQNGCSCDWKKAESGGISVLRPLIQGGGATLAPTTSTPPTIKPLQGRIIVPANRAVIAPSSSSGTTSQPTCPETDTEDGSDMEC